MSDETIGPSGNIIASIKNSQNPDQAVDIVYWKEKNAFVTSGIHSHFAEKEILVPAHLVAVDIRLIGTIISAILEELSRASEGDTAFAYASQFNVLDKTYSLTEEGVYMRLERI
jgi:hypothetical protein